MAVLAVLLTAGAPATVRAEPEALPPVLSPADAGRYHEIFAVQENGRWREADRLIDTIEDPVLLGHVMAQRYLHPTAYRSRFQELKVWLEAHSDHPQAERIHRLAKRRSGGAWTPPAQRGALRGSGPDDHLGSGWRGDESELYGHLSRAERARVRVLKRRFARAINRGHTLVAKRILGAAETQALVHRIDLDRMRGMQGFKYFLDGRLDWAMDWAAPASERSGARAPMAHWAAGLASWRKADFEAARRHFEALASAAFATPWMASAGGYWAARANLRTRRPETVNRWLEIAAEHPRTFYGVIARRALGFPLGLAWDEAPMTGTEQARLLAIPAARRAIALVQVARPEMAARELRKAYVIADPGDGPLLLRLAERAGLPGAAMRIASALRDRDGTFHDSARYPVPRWAPDDGWQVDRALVLAFVRQESGFDPFARSPAGARGLMQLMPSTAAYISGERALRWQRDRLHDPAFNLELGQKYLRYLMDNPRIGGNLFLTAAAYNAGPSNLARWREAVDAEDDPLLFIESLPSRQTRIFIERVLANFWIYRDRLGQDVPSLDRLVAGDWPLYAGLDALSANLAAQSPAR